MEMIANDPKKAKQLGVPQSVGQDFAEADKGKKFSTKERPDLQKANVKKTDHGQTKIFKKGGDVKDDSSQDKALIKKAIKMHDKQEHKGSKGTNLAKLCRGGGIEVKGKTKGKMV